MYLKQMEVVSQPEFIKGDIQEIVKSYKTIKKWAYILHDKDDTPPHYHIYLNFGDKGLETAYVASWFGLQEQFVSKVKGRATDMLLYLIHGNDSQKFKHQYDPSEVIANFDFMTSIKNAKILGDWEKYSYAQQLEYVHTLAPSERAQAFRQLRLLWQEYCQWLSLQTDREIEVYFICGKGGTGKTYYAKKLLKQMNLDYCISSSSNDPFQDYLGQKAIILDDMRDRTYDNLAILFLPHITYNMKRIDIRKIDYRHYILTAITLAFLALAIFVFPTGINRIIEGGRDFGLSMAYYALEIFEIEHGIIPTVNTLPEVYSAPFLQIAESWEQFQADWGLYWQRWTTAENFTAYMDYLGDLVYYLSKILLIIMPLFLLLYVALQMYLNKQNNDTDVDSAPLKTWKRIEKVTYVPIKAWITDFIAFINEHTTYYGDKRYRYVKRYSPNKAEELYRLNLTTHGPALKIGNDHEQIEYIEERILKDKLSPCAVLGEIKREKLFDTDISKTTLYRYIRSGLFLHLEMKDCPMYKQKKTYQKATAKRPPKGTSIEQRPKEINKRTSFGHWEMDCIIGKRYTKDTLLVFTERLTRYVIVLKMPNHKALTVVNYVDLLEERYGELFPTLFKSITVDNGVEFSDHIGIEYSKDGTQRTKVYYCHPYTSCERGSNERMNRDIRRQLPKGTDFTKYTDEQIQWVEDWVNAYPREMFGYATARSRFEEELNKLCA